MGGGLNMIIRETIGNKIKIYSSNGKALKQIQTGRIYQIAYELVDGLHYDYEEVIE